MRPVGSGLFELVIVRSPDLEQYQGVFQTFPKLQKYSTSDLYEPHSSKPGLWRFRMRSDDIICFNNAEKLNPITMEATITGHAQARSAVIGGHGQFQSCVLLEPQVFPRTRQEAEQLLDDMWSAVKEANKDYPAHGRVMKNFILLSDPERPLPRAGKGTVQRAAVFELYEKEFQAIYSLPGETKSLFTAIGRNLPEASTQPKVVDSTSDSATLAQSVTESHISSVANSIKTSMNGRQTMVAVSEVELHVERYLNEQLPRIIKQCLDSLKTEVAYSLLSGGLTLSETALRDEAVNGDVNGHHLSASDGVSVLGRSDKSNSVSTASDPPMLDIQSLQSIKASLRYTMAEMPYVDTVTDEANMFDNGLDSVQVPELRAAINAVFSEHLVKTGPVSVKMIYDNPSVNQLANGLHELMN